MLVGSLVFLISSVSCALAPNLQAMIAIRVIQGASGAVLIPLIAGVLLAGSAALYPLVRPKPTEPTG